MSLARLPISPPRQTNSQRRHLIIIGLERVECALPNRLDRHGPLLRSDFAYELPKALIAQTPLPERDRSRLMEVRKQGVAHRRFDDLPELLASGDLLVVNDTRVIPARLRGRKDSGGAVELLLERIEEPCVALCQIRASKPLQPGRALLVADARLTVLGRVGEFCRLRFPCSVADFLERHGEVPLPAYIGRAPKPQDAQRYQTIFGVNPGAVAAPTAGLHFTPRLVAALARRGVERAAITLHVGAGTFQPVRTEDIRQHRLHAERYQVPAETVRKIADCRAAGGRVVALGTTVARALETAAADSSPGAGTESGSRTPAIAAPKGQTQLPLPSPGGGETRLFIAPGHRFRVVDALLTNFHLPESSLLMLVCALAGHDRVMAAYRSAVAEKYRFFSYGDAMFVERHASGLPRQRPD